MTSSFDFEVIPLSPIPFLDARWMFPTSSAVDEPNGPRILMRGNTLIGAARTVLKSSPKWLRVGDDGRAGGDISPDMPLRCSDLMVPADTPVMRGVPINISRMRDSISGLCAAHAAYPFVDIGIPRTFLPRVTIGLPAGPAKSLMVTFAAACNRFFGPQWDGQRERDAAHHYAYGVWLERSQRIWVEHAIDRSIGEGSGFLVRIGHWSGCEARTLHTKYKPRRVRSRRSATGCFTDRRTPKSWWMVTAAALGAAAASPTQCAPVGWAFLRLRTASTTLAPAVDVHYSSAAARLVHQWSVYPARPE